MNKMARNTDIWLWLTAPIAILLAVASGSGVFFSGLYRDTPNLVAQAIGQDVITLVVALPTLLIGAFLTSRGSQRARLVWLGGLVYTVYTYVGYAFAVRFNFLWLVVALAFAASSISTGARLSWWQPATLITSVLSLLLCIVGWPDARFGLFINIALIAFLLVNKQTGWLL